MFNHVHQALAQVQELQRRVVENQMFRGWSGRGRMVCGLVALATPVVLITAGMPVTNEAHLIAWGTLCLIAGLITTTALLNWFLRDPAVSRDYRRLRPTLQIFPPIVVGGVLTVAAVLQQQYDWLFGIWMLNYGLSNLAARRVLPRSIAAVGIFYLLAGTACLLLQFPFTNPWPMGVVFCVGEIAAGLILHVDVRRKITADQ